MRKDEANKKLSIIGGGILASLEAYFSYLRAKKHKESLRIRVYEKNASVTQTTTSNIVPSLTPDEILSVVPIGNALVEQLKIKFNDANGIRVDDVEGLNTSVVAKDFQNAVLKYNQDESAHENLTRELLELGKISMDLWAAIYDSGDDEIRAILEASNFNRCYEIDRDTKPALHRGYRIDILSGMPEVEQRANSMCESYQSLGYEGCRILMPDEVVKIDPYLEAFCQSNSEISNPDVRQWKSGAIAIWRPGGCLNTAIFLPKLYSYLKDKMGRDFEIKYDRKVTGVVYETDQKKRINGLRFLNRSAVKLVKPKYNQATYVFCPGESVGTLKKLGFMEPAYSAFAGPTLWIKCKLSQVLAKKYSDLNHCMEVHKEGIVLAWQVRCIDGVVSIGVGGTKAFYGDRVPNINEEFALDRNIVQLNMINEVLPELISFILNKQTQNQQLTIDDLRQLEETGFAKRWVGRRAVAYDGGPTIGHVWNDKGKVDNGYCATHAGSGGVSFGPAITLLNQGLRRKQKTTLKLDGIIDDSTSEKMLALSSSRR